MCAWLKHVHTVLGCFLAYLPHSSLISRSHKWQCGADRFCLVLRLNGIVSGTSSVVLSLNASLSSSCPGLLGASLFEGCSGGLSYIIGASSSEEVTWSLMGHSFPARWSQVSYVVRYSINRHRVLAVDSRHCALAELCHASSIRILHQDSISLHVWARNCIVRHQFYVDTLNVDIVGVDCVRWCSQSCFIILRHNAVPIHSLHD